LAIIIVALVIFILAYTGSREISKVPLSFEPVYDTYLSCVEEETWLGINILETQGGYIELPEFEAGSTYMPFSSQLNFLGVAIPYWYYVSGNNVQKEQVPSKLQIQRELSEFVETRIKECDLSTYVEEGFEIERGTPQVETFIRDNELEIVVTEDLGISKGLDAINVREHEVIVKSNLGSLYKTARQIYDKEQEELFLEERGVDVLGLYAPVSGVEITCSPLVWDADKVFDELELAIEANTFALKSSGESDDYFNLDLDTRHNVRFLNSKEWESTFEVNPTQGRLLMANPVGNQPGLGILGFCYVPYHFVYDLKYPVLIQVEEGEEIFQFPVAVVIKGNLPREPLKASASDLEISEFCEYKNTRSIVKVYDIKGRPLDADISYGCAGTKCYMGKAQGGELNTYFPQCVNGVLTARAEGYEEARVIYSTASPGEVKMYLDKIYDIDVLFKVNGRAYNKEAIISFVSNTTSRTIVYPEQKKISLSEGDYEVQVYVYENSSLKIGGETTEQCYEVPYGVLGFFGVTKKKCVDLEVPEQIISMALAGGGKQRYYVLVSDLERGRVEIDAERLPVPNSLEQLQDNYILFEENGLEINFR
jgi:hypothetical protein